MTNYFVGITAYERPQSLMRLMTQLHQQVNVKTEIHVAYDDPSPPETIKQAVGNKGIMHVPAQHRGRDEYWRLVDQLWAQAQMRRAEWDLFLFVQDDVSIDDTRCLERVGNRIKAIKEHVANVASLNLYGDGPEWNPVARWTGRPVVETAEGAVYASWTDMVCVAFTPLTFNVMPYMTAPTPREERTGESSGVGRLISKTLDETLCAQMMLPEPLVEHADGGVSKMHPEQNLKPNP
jgi:hypothetical protein